MNLTAKHERVPSTEKKLTLTIELQGEELETFSSMLKEIDPPDTSALAGAFGVYSLPHKRSYYFSPNAKKLARKISEAVARGS